MSTVSPTAITDIPQDVLKASSGGYHWRDLLRLSHTNTFFRRIYTSDNVWRPWFRKYFPELTDVNQNFMQAFLHNYAATLQRVKHDGHELRDLGNKFKDDKTVVLTAVSQYGHALCYADDSLKKDKDVVLAAVSQNGWAFNFADNSLKKDKDFALEAVSQNEAVLEYADDRLKKDFDVVMAAVSQSGLALYHADNSLKKDFDIVMAAVSNHRGAIVYAHDSIRLDSRFQHVAKITDDFERKRACDALLKELETMEQHEKSTPSFT
jgi:uncharacterized protein YsxB (DUF464 family)